MAANTLQNSAISLLERCLTTIDPKGPMFITQDMNLQRIEMHAEKTTRTARQAVNPNFMTHTGKPDAVSITESVLKAVIKSLPKVITPEFKDNLSALNAYGCILEPTPDQETMVIATYKNISMPVKKAIAEGLLDYGIRESLKDIPHVNAVAGTISDIATVQLAAIAVRVNEAAHKKLVHNLLNKALGLFGVPSIETPRPDLFMAQVVGRFAHAILQEIEKRESTITPFGDAAHASRDSSFAGKL